MPDFNPFPKTTNMRSPSKRPIRPTVDKVLQFVCRGAQSAEPLMVSAHLFHAGPALTLLMTGTRLSAASTLGLRGLHPHANAITFRGEL